MTSRVLCSKCGADEVICYLTAETAICPRCCEDHEYEYERSERGSFCRHCGEEQEYEPSDDDVGFGSYYEPREPVGIPASEMDGNASVANKSPENRRKWDNWVAFCNSWGHP